MNISPATAALPLLLVGCATSHAVTPLGEGVTVHTFRRDYTNAHLVVRGADFFLVDSGLEGNAPALAADLEAAGFAPRRVKAVVLSHGHADHAGGAGWFHRQFGTPVVAGQGDGAMLGEGHNDRLCPTDGQGRDRLASDQAATFTPFTADTLVDGELPLEPLTGVPGRVVALPGHTAGSLVVLLPGAALVGDLFRGAILGSSAEVHFYMCDLADNARDVQHVLGALAPDAETFFTGHFGPVGRDAVRERFPARGN